MPCTCWRRAGTPREGGFKLTLPGILFARAHWTISFFGRFLRRDQGRCCISPQGRHKTFPRSDPFGFDARSFRLIAHCDVSHPSRISLCRNECHRPHVAPSGTCLYCYQPWFQETNAMAAHRPGYRICAVRKAQRGPDLWQESKNIDGRDLEQWCRVQPRRKPRIPCFACWPSTANICQFS